MPRLPDFREKYPDIEIEFITSVRLVDLTREEADLGIRYGFGEYEGLVSSQLVKGTLMPVCSPAVVQASDGNLTTLLSTARRIQTAGYNEWRDWSRLANIDISATQPAYVIEDFLVAIKAITMGQGLALLPHILVQDQLASGELVQFCDTPLEIEHTFHLAHTTASVRRPFVQTVVEWLRTSLAHLN